MGKYEEGNYNNSTSISAEDNNNPLISDWLWNTMIQPSRYFDSPFFLLYMTGI